MNILKHTYEYHYTTPLGTVLDETYTKEVYGFCVDRKRMQAALNEKYCHLCGKEIKGEEKTYRMWLDYDDHVYCSDECLYKRMDYEGAGGKRVRNK